VSALTNHPSFVQPENESVKLWRYMDFSKFADLIQRRRLYFARSDYLGDKFEGSVPRPNTTIGRELFMASLKASDPPIPDEKIKGIIQQLIEMRRRSREDVFISCWHANENESAAMWRLYSRSGDAFAIQTRYGILKEELPEIAMLGIVRYEDYLNYFLDETNLLNAFMLKKDSFSHEREIRAVLWKRSHKAQEPGQAGAVFSEFGATCEVNLDNLLQSIYVSPESPQWFLDVVRNFCSTYGLSVQVNQSSLSSDALY